MISYQKLRLYTFIFFTLTSLYVLLNMFNKNEDYQLQLGLDLSGGINITIAVDVDEYMKDKYLELSNNIKTELRKNNILCSGFKNDISHIKFNTGSQSAVGISKIKKIIQLIDKNLLVSHNKNLISIKYSNKELKTIQQYVIEQSIDAIRNRVDQYGTKEIIIQTLNNNQLLLQIPGITDIKSVNRLLGKTAKLSFHLVGSKRMKHNNQYKSLPVKSNNSIINANDKIINQNTLIVKKDCALTGNHLEYSTMNFDHYNNPVINLKFNQIGNKIFSDLTKNNIGKRLAIVLDDQIISAPTITKHITGGDSVISGNFTLEEASELVILLRSGSLLAPLIILEQKVSEATLGQESIDSSLIGATLGFILIVTSMVMIYGRLGLISIITISLTILYVLSIMIIFKIVLTLPGIAGIILTMGIAVDANVLINERIKEERELHQGNINSAFEHSLATILDSNITTLIVGAILYLFGYGPIQGFAIALCIGISMSMLISVTATFLLTTAMCKVIYK